jgi:hypothetical protein
LITLAGSRSIRDAETDYWLLRYFAAREDYARALNRVDALLRIFPVLSRYVFPILSGIGDQPKAREPFIALLNSAPPWRANFLKEYPRLTKDLSGLLDLLLSVKDGPNPPTDEELRPYLELLVSQNLVPRAYYAWLQFLPADHVKTLPLLYNGNFEYHLSNLVFDWVVTPMDGAKISFTQVPGQDKRGLFVEFSGQRVAFQNVIQLLVLPHGKYKLSGLYRTDDLENQRGMSWRIYCAQRNDGIAIAETDRVSGTSDGWKDFQTTFDVPEGDDCAAQWLRLELAARVEAEQDVSGSVWYDDLKIAKVEAAGTPQTKISRPLSGTNFERALRRD